jgi:hypothetical protein
MPLVITKLVHHLPSGLPFPPSPTVRHSRKELKDAEKQRRANLTPLKDEDKAKRLVRKLARLGAVQPIVEPVAAFPDAIDYDDDDIPGDNLFNDDEIDDISDRSFFV